MRIQFILTYICSKIISGASKLTENLNLSYFISRRINQGDGNNFSSTIHRIAVASIGLGLAVMIISFLILGGFKETIRDKIVSFGSHLQITKFTLDNTLEEEPISTQKEIFDHLEDFEFISHAQPYAHKLGLLKTDQEVYGVIIKGINEQFDYDRFRKNMVAGEFIDFSDSTYSLDVVISRNIADILRIGVNDEILVFFPQEPVRFRKVNVKGLYYTGMEDFDDRIILGDLQMVQRLNNWGDTLIGGMEVYINDFSQLERAEKVLYDAIDFDLYVEKITDKYLEIFDWLSLINQNVYIFLTIILFVACFNMISILLILIMERTTMIGVMKSLGATNRQLRNIFIYNGMLLIIKGLLWGNIIGIGFGILQHNLKIIRLDPENYYMEFVPIAWDWITISMLNLLIFLVVTSVLLVPTMIISRINPIKAIRFD